jgi:hypothetical protein
MMRIQSVSATGVVHLLSGYAENPKSSKAKIFPQVA